MGKNSQSDYQISQKVDVEFCKWYSDFFKLKAALVVEIKFTCPSTVSSESDSTMPIYVQKAIFYPLQDGKAYGSLWLIYRKLTFYLSYYEEF